MFLQWTSIEAIQIVLVWRWLPLEVNYTRALTNHVPRHLKTLKKRGSQSMVITEDRERGTIRGLHETQKGGELLLTTLYTCICIVSLCIWILPIAHYVASRTHCRIIGTAYFVATFSAISFRPYLLKVPLITDCRDMYIYIYISTLGLQPRMLKGFFSIFSSIYGPPQSTQGPTQGPLVFTSGAWAQET